MKRYEVQLLAPAGSYESLMGALQAGCDEIYIGIGNLNMRARSADNFDFSDLPKIRELCDEYDVKCYVALNTILYEHDMAAARSIIDAVKEHCFDGIFAADMAAILYAREKDVEVHISTQLSVSNYETVKFWSQYADRVVLARELNLNMIKSICDRIEKEQLRGPKGELVEIEIFAHGALCIAVSGRCSMSLYTYNSSANRGACKQNCRKAYKVTEVETGNPLIIDNEYVMSPKDICTIHFLDQLLESGVKVIKLEGRGRSADYVERVVGCYREAIDALNQGSYTPEKIEQWMQRLGTVYHRGMSDGYYLGRPLGEWSATYGSRATQEKHFVGRIQKYFPRKGIAELLTEALEVSTGDEFVITGDRTGVVRGEFSELRTDEEGMIKHVQKKRLVTFPIQKSVRKNDKLYILKARATEQAAVISE